MKKRLFLFSGKVRDLVKETRKLTEIEKGPSAATEQAHTKNIINLIITQKYVS